MKTLASLKVQDFGQNVPDGLRSWSNLRDKSKRRVMRIFWILLLSLSFQNAFAYTDEDFNQYEDYDSIVGDLSSRTSTRSNDAVLDLDSMKLHAGFGFNNTLVNLRPNGNNPDKVTLQGFQLSLGVDLFSPNLITEVGLINYNSISKESYKYSLKEFDLKTYYRHHLNRIVAMRGGVGLGVRYMDISSKDGSSDHTIPISQILIGGEAKMGKILSFVTELSYKNAMTSGSPEKSAMDLAFRVDGHF